MFPRGDPYLTSDAVFGAKKSLIVDLKEVDDAALAKKRGKSRFLFTLFFLFVLPLVGILLHSAFHYVMLRDAG